ncbi:MAG: valine--tRNA ligase [Holosporales bacterium]|nr:valine--tRNA ligase [Holosporales bacterium]
MTDKFILEKNFDYAKYEQEIYNASIDDIVRTTRTNRRNELFVITLPPPNITGYLHIGHAFTSTLQDIMLRFKRQQGFITFGQPGIDHAGIATQIIVENNIEKEGLSRKTLGREKFLQRVWEWKASSGGQIFNQLRRLGMSVDWQTERFTMDPESNKAVVHSFVRLYNDGLIYRAEGMVNWDPILKTAISDLEVSNRMEDGHLWYIRYPINKSSDFLTIATTRPETLFGDTAVAVHPDDPRYKHLIGKQVHLPLTDRRITVIADALIAIEKGTGVLKVTPANSFDDFEIGRRHNLQMLNILNDDATLNEKVPEKFRGLSCPAARDLVIKQLEELGLLEKVEPISHSVPYNDRSNAVIEPRVTYQWFLDAATLAKPAIKAVEDGRIRFIPEQWAATYFEWMNNIRPWCISRQIWWGHQIPVWYAPTGEAFCAETEDEAKQLAAKHFGCDIGAIPTLQQDPDVLDTWYSSGLWPFTTQYWPSDTDELKARYPNSLLVTAFDIIFFWVARMIMLGLYFMNDVPFRDVYIHPLVRDAEGQKMSKSKGNVVDPLELMDKYGTDAMRFTLASLATPGRDIRLSTVAIENSRNFVTKIWNAARFLEQNACLAQEGFDISQITLPINRWVVERLQQLEEQATQAFDNYRFDYVTQNITKFLKDIFCDVYIECLKPCLSGNASDEEKRETRAVAGFVFTEFLKVANPVIPFVTEFLWKVLNPTAKEMLLVAEYSCPSTKWDDSALADVCVRLTEEVRSIRGLLGVPLTQQLCLYVEDDRFREFVARNTVWIEILGKLSGGQAYTGQKSLKIVLDGVEFFLEYPSGIDEAEAKRVIRRKIDDLAEDCELITKRVENAAYIEAAPEKWQADKEKLQQKMFEKQKIEEAFRSLS